MKRRFRQKQDLKPRDDPEKNDNLSEDGAQKNIDIDEVIKEIDTRLEDTEERDGQGTPDRDK